MSVPSVKLTQGIHVLHVFYRVDRRLWASLPAGAALEARDRLENVAGKYPGPAHPRVMTFAGVGGKHDIGFFLMAADLVDLSSMHRELEAAFPPGVLIREYSYLSVTELPEYVATDDDLRAILAREGAVPGAAGYEERFAAAQKRNREYQHYRLYPELEDWEVQCFYPMSKRRQGQDNWYTLNFESRKRLMAGHAKTGRKYAGRISQLITGSAGLDDWEWGVTLMAHQLDAVKEIVYEMRFDEVSARYGEFGPFYIGIRMQPTALWTHLRLAGDGPL